MKTIIITIDVTPAADLALVHVIDVLVRVHHPLSHCCNLTH
jgi:hypothetical protein